jgi:hypothetical protein
VEKKAAPMSGLPDAQAVEVMLVTAFIPPTMITTPEYLTGTRLTRIDGYIVLRPAFSHALHQA